MSEFATIKAVHATTIGTVLCVEDDPVVQLMLGDIILTAGGHYISANCARDAEEMLSNAEFDLILLDRKLPDSDGLLLLQTIKQKSDCPVIILSSMDETRDKILGLGMGAAEYITKPFSPIELSSRIRALLIERKKSRDLAFEKPLIFGVLSLDSDTRLMRIENKEVFLPPAEARLLRILLLNKGKPVSRDSLFQKACGREWMPGDRTVDVLVARLRQKIPPKVAQIVTVHRFGYVLTATS